MYIKTKTQTDKKITDETNDLATRNQRRTCIAQDKDRARRWAKERILKRNLVIVAKGVARVINNNAWVNNSQVLQLSPKKNYVTSKGVNNNS